MHPYCIYVFDSSTANEAAIAVKEGQYSSIIQYHSNKHRPIHHPHENLSPQKMKERESKLNRLGQLAQLTTQPPTPSQPQTSSQQQPPPPPPPQQQQQQQATSAQPSQQQPPLQQQPPPPTSLQPPPPSAQQQQLQPPPPQQQHQQPQVKFEQQEHRLDPLSSMAAMASDTDNFGQHTIHHHPPS